MSFDDVPVAVETNLRAAHRDAITTYTKYFANVESFLLFLSLSLVDSLIAIQESCFGYIFHWNAAQGPMNASAQIPRGKPKIIKFFSVDFTSKSLHRAWPFPVIRLPQI
jgi:hypothetical protein